MRFETQFKMIVTSTGGLTSSVTDVLREGRILWVPWSVSLACLYCDNRGLMISSNRLTRTACNKSLEKIWESEYIRRKSIPVLAAQIVRNWARSPIFGCGINYFAR
jgi:hypothetical protein